MQNINLNMLFAQLLPSYAYILNSFAEEQRVTKAELIEHFKKCCSVNVPRNNLFLHAIHDSRFEAIYKKQGSAHFE